MEMIQRDIEHDSLEQDRKDLIENTGVIRRKRFLNEIHMDNDNLIDELQYGFIKKNPEISFETIEWIKKFCNYMKGN